MSVKGDGNIIPVNACAVICNTDQADAAVFDFDGNSRCFCVDGIFDKLLDDGRRPFNNLPRRNFINCTGIKNVNF